jgi:hypothetical protein
MKLELPGADRVETTTAARPGAKGPLYVSPTARFVISAPFNSTDADAAAYSGLLDRVIVTLARPDDGNATA